MRCGAGSRTFALTQAASEVVPAGSAWLEIRERGQQIAVTAPAGSTVIDFRQPLRFASHWVRSTGDGPVRIALVDAAAPAATYEVVAHCAGEPVPVQWLQRLDAIGKTISAARDPGALRDAIAALDALAPGAPAPGATALVIQYRALAAFGLNRMDDARDAFRQAEQAWLKAGEPKRALAARVGWIESTIAGEHFEAAIAATQREPQRLRAVPYFAARIANVRCRALDELGRLEAARACFRDLLGRYGRLHEMNEYAATLHNVANSERKLGRMATARALVADGMKAVSGPYAAGIRGRLYSLLAEIDRQTGDVAGAFHDMQRADVEFRRSGIESLIRRANGRVYEALLLEQTGAYYEAFAGLSSAWTFLAPKDATRLVAISAKVFADLERDTHHPDLALLWMQVAESMSQQIGFESLHEVARLARLQLQLERGDLAAVARGLAEPRLDLPLYAPQWRLLEAELDVRRNRLDAARRALAAVPAATLTLPERVHLALVDAELRGRAGDPAGAQRILLDCAKWVAGLARRAGSRTLQSVIDRQAVPLRRAGLRMALGDSGGQTQALAAAWPWLGQREPDAAVAMLRPSGASAERFDREVAAELLEPVTAKPGRDAPASARELLSLFGAASTSTVEHADPVAPLPLASLQVSLDTGSAFVAFLDGGTRGALLWVTRDRIRLFDTAPPDRLRASTSLLLGLLASANSSVGDIQRAADLLAGQLLGQIPPGPPPRGLLVLAGELAGRVPWSALPWPGGHEPLVASTDVRHVLLVAPGEHAPAQATSPLHVFVAAQGAPGGELPELAVAGAEPALIRAAVGTREMTIAVGRAATRDALLDALGQPGAWVHVAAHGAAQPDRLGYAGLWLEPGSGSRTPQFLSWLDILDRGVGADMVVLDACRLGDAGSAIDGNLSFADAVARAGANQVVAALWPVSDAAAALWVPAFYAALDAGRGDDAAHALRAAQLRLRGSREFRHPFYWAGMESIGRYAVAVEASAGAPAVTVR